MGLIDSIVAIAEDIWDAITSVFSSSPATKPAQTCPVPNGVMTPAQAQAYMDKFKKTDIPFNYPVDCCYARARTMCAQMEKDGFNCQKFWYAGNLHPVNADGSTVTFPDAASPVTWGYHVAPMVPVQQPDGTVQQMIMDPSLSDKPLTVDEWKARCNSISPSTAEYTSDSQLAFPFNNARTAVLPDPKVNGVMTEDEAKDKLDEHKQNRDAALNALP